MYVINRYIAISEEWTIGTPMPSKRGDMAIGVVGPKVICAGGLGTY
jgi:hypothetical protein